MRSVMYFIIFLISVSGVVAYQRTTNTLYGFTDWQIIKKDYFQEHINYKIEKVDEFNYILKWERNDVFVWETLENCFETLNDSCVDIKASKKNKTVRNYTKEKTRNGKYKTNAFTRYYFNNSNRNKVKSDWIKLKNKPFPKNKSRGVIIKGEVNPYKKNNGSVNISLPFNSIFKNNETVKIGFGTFEIIIFSNGVGAEQLDYTFYKGSINRSNRTRYLSIPQFASINNVTFDIVGVRGNWSPFIRFDYFDDKSINNDIWDLQTNIGIKGSASNTETGSGLDSWMELYTSENDVGSSGGGVETTSIDAFASDEANTPYVELVGDKSLIIRVNYSLACYTTNTVYSTGRMRIFLSDGTTTGLTEIRSSTITCSGSSTKSRIGEEYLKLVVNTSTTNVSVYNMSDVGTLLSTTDYSSLGFANMYLDVRSESDMYCNTGETCTSSATVRIKEIGYTTNSTNYVPYVPQEGFLPNGSYMEVGTKDNSPEWNFSLRNGARNITHYWKLNRDGGDSIGGYEGVLTNITFKSGQINDSAFFDTNSNSGIDLGRGMLAGNEWTITAWINPNITGTSLMIFEARDSSSTNNRILVSLFNNILQVLVYNNAGTLFKQFQGSYHFSSGVWEHIGVTWNGSDNDLRLYVNGTRDPNPNELTNTTSSQVNTVRDMSIGIGRPSGSSFNGSIDDVRFYTRALTEINISNIRDGNYTPSQPVNFKKQVDEILPDCDCEGCVLSSGDCLIPFFFYSPLGGIITYSNLIVNYNVSSATVNINTYKSSNSTQLITGTNITIQGIGDIFQQETDTNATGTAKMIFPFNSSTPDLIEFRAFQKDLLNDTDYSIEIRQLRVNQGDNLTLDFYMQDTINTTITKRIQIIVKDEFFDNIQSALIHVFKQNPSTNQFLPLTDLTTNQQGETEYTFFIDTVFYKFTVEYQGKVVYSSPEPIQIGELNNQITLVANVGGDVDNFYQTILGVITSMNFVQVSDSSGKFTATWTNDIIIEGCINVSIINTSGKFTVELMCMNGTTGNIESSVFSPNNVTLYEARLTGDFKDGYGHRYLRNYIEYIGIIKTVGKTNLVILIMFAIVIAGFGFASSPVIGLIVLSLEFITLAIIDKTDGFRGVMPMSTAMVIVTLCIISIITVSRIRR